MEKKLNDIESFEYYGDLGKRREIKLPKPVQFCSICNCFCCSIYLWMTRKGQNIQNVNILMIINTVLFVLVDVQEINMKD